MRPSSRAAARARRPRGAGAGPPRVPARRVGWRPVPRREDNVVDAEFEEVRDKGRQAS